MRIARPNISEARRLRSARANAKAMKTLAAFGVAGALATGGAAVSGCGASETLDPVARAAEVTSQQPGAKVSLTMRFASSALSSGFTITANGYIDNRDRSGEMSMNLAGLPGATELAGGSGTIQVIYQFPEIYMNMPLLAGKLPEGKTWMELDVTKAAQAAGINLSQFSSLDETDPTQFLDYLRASAGGVTAVGHESLYGVPTTHYRAMLQLSSILERLPSSEQTAAKAALEKLGDAGAIPVDVWVDAQGRVRRMELSMGAAIPGAASDEAGTATDISSAITVDFPSYGPIPPIVPPPSNEVFDATALASAGLAQEQNGG
jgi:hypothetical protein